MDRVMRMPMTSMQAVVARIKAAKVNLLTATERPTPGMARTEVKGEEVKQGTLGDMESTVKAQEITAAATGSTEWDMDAAAAGIERDRIFHAWVIKGRGGVGSCR